MTGLEPGTSGFLRKLLTTKWFVLLQILIPNDPMAVFLTNKKLTTLSFTFFSKKCCQKTY